MMSIRLFILFLIPLSAFSEVLYWQVTDVATVDGVGIQSFLNQYTLDEDHWNAVRVRASGGNLASPVYLDLYLGGGYSESGELGMEIGDVSGSGYWGCGVPTGNQSPFGSEFAEECLFALELGYNVYDSALDVLTWETIAESDEAPISALRSYIYTEFDLNPPTTRIWTPDSFRTAQVPEPRTCLLVLTGACALCLSRRNRRLSPHVEKSGMADGEVDHSAKAEWNQQIQ